METAALGTSLNDQLYVLKDFRDTHLLTNPTGRWFVKRYYTYSPALARWLQQKEWAKAITRTALKPLIASAKLFQTPALQDKSLAQSNLIQGDY